MKKLLIAGALLMSVAAIQASKQTGKTALALSQAKWNITDTVPKDTTDTTHKPQFYGSVAWNNINDTVPKNTSDTTHKPQFYRSVVWNAITDTVPKDTTDTTHKPQLYALR